MGAAICGPEGGRLAGIGPRNHSKRREAMGLIKDRVDKDLSLYAGNIEKMSQAVELMEETLAAERRRRERAAEASS